MREALKRAVIIGSERHSCHWALTGQPENWGYGILPKDDLSRSSQAAAVHYWGRSYLPCPCYWDGALCFSSPWYDPCIWIWQRILESDVMAQVDDALSHGW